MNGKVTWGLWAARLPIQVIESRIVNTLPPVMDQKYQCHLVSPGPPRLWNLEHFRTSLISRMESSVMTYVCNAVVRKRDVIFVVISQWQRCCFSLCIVFCPSCTCWIFLVWLAILSEILTLASFHFLKILTYFWLHRVLVETLRIFMVAHGLQSGCGAQA